MSCDHDVPRLTGLVPLSVVGDMEQTIAAWRKLLNGYETVKSEAYEKRNFDIITKRASTGSRGLLQRRELKRGPG